jgi:hypothetical protein
MSAMSTFSRCCQSACFVLLLAGAVARVSAASILYTGEGFNEGNSGVTIGLEFTPAVDMTVTDLGVLDGGADGPGIQTPHDVGLYTDVGTLLASSTVDNSGILQQGFRFVSISPVVLSAGQTYVLAAYYPAGFVGDKLEGPVLNPYPLVNLATTSRFEGGSSLTFPDATTNPNFRLTANMLFTANTTVVGDGDLNFDGNVDAADVGLATRIVLGELSPSANQLVAGDIAPYIGGASQPDNEITLSDLLLIMRIALGTFTL